jgi:hypothetical protein
VPEEDLPSGFYQFSRRSFVDNSRYVRGLVYVKRDGHNTYLKGFEPRYVMAMQGIPDAKLSREYRGFVIKVEDGVAMMVSRINGLTASFNFLNRVSSFENNYWVGYVARTTREDSSGARMTRMVFEHLPQNYPLVLKAARQAGFCDLEELVPYHQRLLQPKDPFR